MIEHWKWVPGYEGRYRVSDQGQVMSVGFVHKHPRNGSCLRVFKPRILKPAIAVRPGYPIVGLVREQGVQDKVWVHRLVLLAFVGAPDAGKECNHKNGDKTDNRLANLEWVTSSENKAHAYRTGLHKPNGGSGERTPWAKLTDSQAREILTKFAGGERQIDLAREYEVSASTIHLLVRRKKWKHL